ncbi:hypothetical protein BTHERMOSOX_491 [Bathymodiolus thermophilus thioautotrophic gill symbiont]|nr:hypothetical protein BTHERMOSOX_491 [Bathymodiolus thermophilus thioautotrophic gill symbiont]
MPNTGSLQLSALMRIHLKPSLSPARKRFKKITKWAKIEFC